MKKCIYVLMTIMVFSAVLAACSGETASTAVEAAGAAASQFDEVNPTAVIAAVAGTLYAQLQTFIFPAMFVVILGPAVISIMDTFSTL